MLCDVEWLKQKCEWYNSTTGHLKGYNCPKCKNRGDFAFIYEGYEMYRDCECMKVRNAIRNANNSGLANTFKANQISNYEAKEDWQQDVLKKAKSFVNSNKYWYCILGESGSGKTHICTGIARELLLKGMGVKYMRWVEDSNKLKACINEPNMYENLLDSFKNADVLYIDDLFKIEPTSADIKLAYELLNFRYSQAKANKKRYVTMISSERTFRKLMEYDTAIAGRINEMCGEYLISVFGKEKNRRIH